LDRFRALAEEDHAGSQYYLASMYDTEKDVPKNGTIAVQWYSLAAQQGHLYAQSRLGYMHENSKGAPKNYVIAYVW